MSHNVRFSERNFVSPATVVISFRRTYQHVLLPPPEEKVLADLSERGRIVSASYWQKFRVFMDEVAAADFVERTDMLVSRVVF